MAKIRLNGIYKHYNKEYVVKNICLESEENELIVIVGPSGCGKSTILKIVAGIEKPSNGEVYIDEKVMNTIDAANRDVSMVFQTYSLYPHMSVFENLEFPLKTKGIKKREREKRVLDIASMLEICDYLKRKPAELSGGQRQRVAIGRALIRQPKVILFDEPLSNLDAALREKMRSELLLLHKKTPAVFLYVTHDQIEAMSMGDRIAVMSEGVIQQIDTPYNIYHNPCNLFVASFLGVPKINIFDYKNISQLLLPSDYAFTDEYIYGIRAEHIIASIDEVDGNITIAFIELLGKDIMIHANIDNCSFIVSLPNSNDIYDKLLCANKIKCQIDDLSNILVFDKNTGNRVY